MSVREQLAALGFSPAGRYADGAFDVSEEWRSLQVVYVWTHVKETDVSPLRVGIACGKPAFGGRFKHYNRWLAGRFKPNDQREQKVRSLFLAGLGREAQVWALAVSGKPKALEVESALRAFWGDRLDLDLMVRDSWGKRQMDAWRAAGRPPPAGFVTLRSD